MPEGSDDQAAAQHEDSTLPRVFLFRIETKQEAAIEPVTQALAPEAREPRGGARTRKLPIQPCLITKRVNVLSASSHQGRIGYVFRALRRFALRKANFARRNSVCWLLGFCGVSTIIPVCAKVCQIHVILTAGKGVMLQARFRTQIAPGPGSVIPQDLHICHADQYCDLLKQSPHPLPLPGQNAARI